MPLRCLRTPSAGLLVAAGAMQGSLAGGVAIRVALEEQECGIVWK